jgi:hypothetical protein
LRPTLPSFRRRARIRRSISAWNPSGFRIRSLTSKPPTGQRDRITGIGQLGRSTLALPHRGSSATRLGSRRNAGARRRCWARQSWSCTAAIARWPILGHDRVDWSGVSATTTRRTMMTSRASAMDHLTTNNLCPPRPCPSWKNELTLRQEARKRRITSNVKPFIGTLRVTNPVR